MEKNLKSRQFATARFMPRSPKASYQAYTTQYHGKATRKRIIPQSQHWPYNISGDCSILFIKIIRINQQKTQPLSTVFHRPPGLQLSLPWSAQQPNISEIDQPRLAVSANALKIIEPRSPPTSGRTTSLFGFSSLNLGGFFTNAFSFSPSEPPELAG